MYKITKTVVFKISGVNFFIPERMMNTVSPEEILKEVEALRKTQSNEAETRLKLINRILLEILGWTHSDLNVEERVSEDGKVKYADYILRTGFTSIVVEAKKVGQFDSDLSLPNKRNQRLSNTFLNSKVGEAIRQARDYARKMSIPFAAVTDGSHWIIFPATRTDEVKFSDSKAIIFKDAESALRDHLRDFLDLFSRDAVIGGALNNALLGRIEDQYTERRLNKFFLTQHSQVKRYSLFPHIENEIRQAFLEDLIESDIDLFRKSYVETPERRKFDPLIRMAIAKRDSPTNSSTKKVLTPSGRSAFAVSIEKAVSKSKPSVVLLLGQVGAGKTTFINYIRYIKEAQRFKTQNDAYPHWISINCKNLTSGDSPSDFILSNIFDYILSNDFLSSYERCVRVAYKKEIDALKLGPLAPIKDQPDIVNQQISQYLSEEYNKKFNYAEKVISYAAKNSAIFLVIDNVDQFESADFQSQIFSDAVALSERSSLNLILAMRDSTFVQHKSRPVFDAFDVEFFQVEPPDVQSVLSKRFVIAKELLKYKPTEFTAENGAKMQISDSSIIIDLITQSVLNSSIGNLLSVLTTGDIRLCLRMTRDFLRTGYTATGKAMRIYQNQGYYNLPLHEAFRAILLGNQTVYSEKLCSIANPFDARLNQNKPQLLRMFILQVIVNKFADNAQSSTSGKDIESYLKEIGFGSDLTLRLLNDLCERRLIFTTSHAPASIESYYVPSQLGGYILRDLISNLVFLENMMMDTFVESDEIWNKLYQLTNEIHGERNPYKKFKIRKVRIETFFDFLANLYSELNGEAVRRSLPRECLGNPFKEAQSKLKENLSQALTSAKKNYG